MVFMFVLGIVLTGLLQGGALKIAKLIGERLGLWEIQGYTYSFHGFINQLSHHIWEGHHLVDKVSTPA